MSSSYYIVSSSLWKFSRDVLWDGEAVKILQNKLAQIWRTDKSLNRESSILLIDLPDESKLPLMFAVIQNGENAFASSIATYPMSGAVSLSCRRMHLKQQLRLEPPLITVMINYYHLKNSFNLTNEKLSGDEQRSTLNVSSKSLIIVIMFSTLLRNVLLLLIFFFLCNWWMLMASM